jgi:hypothetical protein
MCPDPKFKVCFYFRFKYLENAVFWTAFYSDSDAASGVGASGVRPSEGIEIVIKKLKNNL